MGAEGGIAVQAIPMPRAPGWRRGTASLCPREW